MASPFGDIAKPPATASAQIGPFLYIIKMFHFLRFWIVQCSYKSGESVKTLWSFTQYQCQLGHGVYITTSFQVQWKFREITWAKKFRKKNSWNHFFSTQTPQKYCSLSSVNNCFILFHFRFTSHLVIYYYIKWWIDFTEKIKIKDLAEKWRPWPSMTSMPRPMTNCHSEKGQSSR